VCSGRNSIIEPRVELKKNTKKKIRWTYQENSEKWTGQVPARPMGCPKAVDEGATRKRKRNFEAVKIY